MIGDDMGIYRRKHIIDHPDEARAIECARQYLDDNDDDDDDDDAYTNDIIRGSYYMYAMMCFSGSCIGIIVGAWIARSVMN